MSSVIRTAREAASSVGMSIEQAALEWVRHVESLWFKRLAWIVALGAAFALGTAFGARFL